MKSQEQFPSFWSARPEVLGSIQKLIFFFFDILSFKILWDFNIHVVSSFFFFLMGFPGGAVIKNLPATAGDAGDMGSIPGLGRSPGGGNGNPPQYSCLENSMD